jgi:hypothetical protein
VTGSTTKTISSGVAAVLLGVTPVSVSNFARAGALKHFRRNGKLYFDVADVEALRRQRAARPRAGRRGRPTLLESIKTRISAGTAAESAEGPRAPVSRPTRGTKTTGSGRPPSSRPLLPRGPRRPAPAALRDYVPTLLKGVR